MSVTAELFANPAVTAPVVTSGGTTTPSSGTSESWTVTGLSGFPAVSSAASPPTFCRCCDPALPGEVLWITNISGTTATVTRGAEGSTTANHGSNFTLELLITAGGLGQLAQGWPGLISSLVAKTATYTATAADNVIVCNATTAAFTVNLPTAVGALGRTYTVKKTDSSANAVTVDPNSTQTIDGATTWTLAKQWQSVTVVSDGANWQATGNALTLDTTAGDIQPLGTQAAGAQGMAADAKHVHAMPRLDQVAAPTAAVALGSQKITGLANGTAASDAAAFGQIPSLAPYAPLAGATFTGPVTVTSLAEAVVSKSANYTATSADSVILCDATSAAFTITLPAASTATGRLLTLKKTDTGANIVTVDGNASETIDGALAVFLYAPGQYIEIVSDGAAWRVIAGTLNPAVSAVNLAAVTTTETVMAVMPASAATLLAGSVFRAHIWAKWTNPVTTASSWTLNLRAGTAGTTADTQVIPFTHAASTTAESGIDYYLQLEYAIITAGASGTMQGYIWMNNIQIGMTASSTPTFAGATVPVTSPGVINTTTATRLVLSIQAGTTGTNSFTVKTLTFEQVR